MVRLRRPLPLIDEAQEMNASRCDGCVSCPVASSTRRRCFASFLAGDARFIEKPRREERFVSQQFGETQPLPRERARGSSMARNYAG